jgi:FG-GAP-like repeat
MAGLFQVLYGTSDATFEPAVELLGADGQPLIIPADEEHLVEKICTCPVAVDIDDDGNLDIVTGNFAGTFYVFEGMGKGRFNPTCTKLTTGNGDLHIKGAHSDPFFIDWDGDGDLDMLSGSSQGGVYLMTNTGTRKTPAFAEPTQLLGPVGDALPSERFGDAHLKGPQAATRVWAADVNGDARLDLLVGDNVELMHTAEGVDEATARAKDAEWQKRFNDLLSHQPDGGNPQAAQKWSEQYQKLNEERSEFVVIERTGFVWLYIRK